METGLQLRVDPGHPLKALPTSGFINIQWIGMFLIFAFPQTVFGDTSDACKSVCVVIALSKTTILSTLARGELLLALVTKYRSGHRSHRDPERYS